MGLLDLFRPKWKHSDAEVRAEAVRDLDDADTEALVRVVTQDADAKVRKIALRKIRDLQFLGTVAQGDADEGLRRFASERLRDLAVETAVQAKDEAQSLAALERLSAPRAIVEVACAARSDAVRRAAVARLNDTGALAEVALRAGDVTARQLAVARINDAKALVNIALGDSEKEAGLAALKKVSDPASLELIARNARSKAVRSAARERMAPAAASSALAAGPSPEDVIASDRRRERQLELCARVEAVQGGTDWERDVAAVKAARAAWAQLGSATGDDEVRDRFYAACERFARQHERHLQEQMERTAAQARERRRVAEVPEQAEPSSEQLGARATLEELCAEAEALRGPPRTVEQHYRNLERVWHEVEARAAPPEELRQRFTDVGTRLAAQRDEERARHEREQAELRAEFERFCAHMEELATVDALRPVSQALKDAGQVFASANHLPRDQQPSLRARFQAARQALVVRLEQLREAEEWKRWANVPQLEQLCLKMEALREVEDPVAAARELRSLQKEWKAVGPATRDKSEALWARFKLASDEIHKRCQEQFVVLDEQRAQNLKQKLELCEKVEALRESTDWKATSEALKALQAEWKAMGPVPKEQADQVWQRFRAACDHFFSRLKAHHQEVDAERAQNLLRQEELCAKVEALRDSSQWKSTADAIKSLQAEWKTIGPAPRDRADEVWQRFRGACDHFFDRRKAHFEKQDAERAQNLELKLALCDKVEKMLESDEEDDQPVADVIKQLMAEWKTIGPAPKDQADAVWERFCKACDYLRDSRR